VCRPSSDPLGGALDLRQEVEIARDRQLGLGGDWAAAVAADDLVALTEVSFRRRSKKIEEFCAPVVEL
jgi:hypothetical protein